MSAIDPRDVELNCELPFAEFINPKTEKSIVSNQTFQAGDWNRICALRDLHEGVSKKVVPVDFSDFRFVVISDVEPNTDVSEHVHHEDIVRYIIEGSLTLNGTNYEQGDWILVPEDMPYSISTKTGYKAVAGYGVACGDPGGGTENSEI